MPVDDRHRGIADRGMAAAPAVALLLLILATTAVYWPGLNDFLLLDDYPQLNGLIEASGDEPSLLVDTYLVSNSGPLGRPVAMATFIADAVTHGPDIGWWKYNNLMLHLLCGLLVTWFSLAILRAVRPADGVASEWAALAIGAVWLLHPLQVSTVLYTVQRMTELSTLFVLAGLVCYAQGRLLQPTRPKTAWLLIVTAFIVCLPLAALAKESGLLLPVFISLVELLVFRFRGAGSTPRGIRLLHGGLLAAYTVAAGVVLAGFQGLVLDGYAFRDFGLVERVLTQFRVVCSYLGQILLPHPGHFGFFHDDVAVSTGMLTPATTLFGAAAIAGLLASAIWLWRRVPLYAFGVLFFFASHALESTVFALELMFEHRNYIGIAGIAMAAYAIGGRFLQRPAAQIAVALIVVAALGALTWQRVAVWSRSDSAYTHMYAIHPTSPRLNNTFATVFADAREFDRARAFVAAMPDGPGARLYAAWIDCREFRRVAPDRLIRVTGTRNARLDGVVTSTTRKIVDLALRGDCSLSGPALLSTLDGLAELRGRTAADRESILIARAQLIAAAGDVDAAVRQYRELLESSPQDALPLYLAADLLARSGRPADAHRFLAEGAALEHDQRRRRTSLATPVWSGVADLFARAGAVDPAMAVLADARAAIPREAGFALQAAEILLAAGRNDEARAMLAVARQFEAERLLGQEHRLLLVQRRLDERSGDLR